MHSDDKAGLPQFVSSGHHFDEKMKVGILFMT
jgi:hypothetical protein